MGNGVGSGLVEWCVGAGYATDGANPDGWMGALMIHGPDIKLVGCVDDRGYALLEGS